MNAKTSIQEVIKSTKDYNAEMDAILAEAAALRQRMEAMGEETAKLKRQVSAEKGRRTKATRYW